MANPLVLIVGAGPTGMTAAIECRRMGFDVRIVDKSDHMAEHSQALVLQARTLEQLQRYGLAEEAVTRGRKLDGAEFFSSGRLITTFTLTNMDSRYPFALFLPQSETEALLNRHMESLGVKTERSVELAALNQGETLQATLGNASGQTEIVLPQWVIGCDGAHSAVRTLSCIPFEGGGVGLSFFLGDLELEGPDVPGNRLSLHLHKGDVVFMGRLDDRLVRVIIALHEEQEHQASPQHDRPLSISDFQRAMDAVGARATVRASEWMTPFHVRDMQAKHYRAGNVFLAGDASHIHSPVGGQGMNTGIQDVANLAWKLGAVARGADSKLLDSYEEERGAVGKALLRFTERGLKLASSANPVLTALRDAMAPLMANLHPIQKRAVGFISETAIEYRSSSVVKDEGGDGDLRAGDRLPDLALAATGNETLLKVWTQPRHLALAIGASEAEAQSVRAVMPAAETRRVLIEALDEHGRRLLGKTGKLIVVRPDGYVGFRGPLDRSAGWQAYARQNALG